MIGRGSRAAFLTAGLAVLAAAISASTARADWVVTSNASGEKWVNGAKAGDRDPATYAADQINVADWGKPLVFTFEGGVLANCVRFNADRWTGAVDKVLVKVFYADGTQPEVKTFYAMKDGQPIAENADEGYPNAAFKEFTIARGFVNKVEFQFHYTKSGYIFWLYELQLFQVVIPVVPPQVGTQEPTNVTATSAALHGQVLSDGGALCKVGFHWGATQEYGNYVELPGLFAKDALPTWRLSGLTAGTTYHYCICASNPGCTDGPVRGGDRTFVACQEESDDGALWMTPIQQYPPLGGWEQPDQAIDDWEESAARCYHTIHDTQVWSPPIQLHPAPGLYNGLRFKAAKPDAYIDKIKIELEVGSNWQVLYEGTFKHNTWEVKDFPLCALRDARVSFHMSTPDVGEYWTLYEFDFRQAGVNLVSAGIPYYLEENPGVFIAPQDKGMPLAFKFGPGIETLTAGTVTIATSANLRLFMERDCYSPAALSYDLSVEAERTAFVGKVCNKTLYVQASKLSAAPRDQFVSCTLVKKEVDCETGDEFTTTLSDKVCYTVVGKVDLRADTNRDGVISTERDNDEDRHEDDLLNNPLGATIAMGEANKARLLLRLVGPVDRERNALYISTESVVVLPDGYRTMGSLIVCLANSDGTLRQLSSIDNLLTLTQGDEIELFMVGTRAGCARVRAWYSQYPTPEDSLVVNVIDARLEAGNDSNLARTNNAGTSAAPKTLLARMDATWQNQPAAAIKVDFNDVGTAEEDIPGCTVAWKVVEQPGQGNFEGNAPTAPAEIVTTKATHHTATFFGPAAGRYRFEAALGTVKKEIVAYVGTARLDSAPDYLFALATGAVPFEVSFDGTAGAPVMIDDSGTSGRDFHWSLSHPDPNYPGQFQAVAFATRLPLGKVGSDWSASQENDGGRGTSTSYAIVSQEYPLEDVDIGGTGLLDKVRIELLLAAKIKLSGEETNYASFAVRKDNLRIADNSHPVYEIGTTVTYENAFSCLTGSSRFDHIASDDNNKQCSGYAFSQFGLPVPQLSTFTAGDDERYAAPNEKHYHTNPTTVRGFNESDDTCVAGMTTTLNPAGLVVEARLLDGTEWWWTEGDDEEEYVAKAIGGGIVTCAWVSYRLRNSAWFGNFCDISANGTSGLVFPRILPNTRWTMHLSAAETSLYQTYSSTVFDSAGVALGTAGLIITLAGPPAWATAGVVVGAVGVISSAASLVNDISGFTSYSGHCATAMIRKTKGKTQWNNAGLQANSTSATGTNAEVYDDYSSGGMWGDPSAKIGVSVGDHIRTGVEIICTAQNESNELLSTPDVIGRVTLGRFSGSADLRTVVYEK